MEKTTIKIPKFEEGIREEAKRELVKSLVYQIINFESMIDVAEKHLKEDSKSKMFTKEEKAKSQLHINNLYKKIGELIKVYEDIIAR